MDVTGNLAWLAPLFGVVAMVLTSFVKRPDWSATKKTVVLTVASVAMAVLQLAISGTSFDVANLGATVGVVLSTATVLYNTYFKSTGINSALEQIGTPKDHGV